MDNSTIKDLQQLYGDKTHQVIYRKESNNINEITGEVTSSEKVTVAKEKTRAGFIKLFVDNLDYVVKLDNSEKMLFFRILRALNYKNVFMFDKSFRKRIEEGKILSRTAMYRAFKSLVEKEIILKISDFPKKEDINFLLDDDMSYLDDGYVANPDIVGKGNWAELENLKKTIVLNYDFKNYEVTKKVSQEATYKGFDEIANNQNQHEVKQVSQYISSDNKHSETNIIIGERKDGGDIAVEAQVVDEPIKLEANHKSVDNNNASAPLTEREIELAILNAENKKLELQLELKKLNMQEKNQSTKETE
ncbi:hypothetical protein GZ989_011400 (plasmid) [Campylobacter fetus]|uniref:Plasmid replication protein RepL domain-containing protein n=1 Tax=Campylobacter fetus TaxID=196 RepID=A0A974MUP5_CAMFE|nr:hypothetical protein [Campylobacter fetus]OCS32908.1 hypothetical protein AWR31_08190 [Campylobacter fetus subsp. venerealis]QMS59878.1 hypothetical protein GZ989_011400 [Campylobacter fetus]